ncbi:MAG: hypothetical protein LBD22_02645, partial [Spirochaetaceae bacterium]|nr:hypothetical protein [Spirochaetaceae bacterium]
PLNLNNDVYIDIEASSEDRASANHAFTTAAYSLLEYKSPEQKFGAELGLRLDHLYFIGKDFTIQTIPAFNPRLNIDINIMKNKGFIDLFNVTAGTGFFSSLTESLANLRSADGIDDYELKQNRSFTSLVGTKITFLDKWSFNIEGYYKHIYNRAYYINYVDSNMVRQVDYLFDGQGRVWGFDFILQKMESRFVDGWISYTYSHARYLNPLMVDREGRIFEGSWRYPNFHRFHNLNLVLNLKPSRRTNIGVRFGYASGTPLSVPGQIEPHPVLVVRPSETFFIQKYKRQTYYSETRRNGFALPLDIKLSFFSFTKAGKTQGEVYIAVENTLSFLKTREKNTTFNEYTGVEVEGSDTASYQMPVPMISFGFTWSY